MSAVQMSKYVSYDPATGAIISYGETHVAALEAASVDGGPFLIGEGNSDEHYVDLENLQIRRKTTCPARLSGLNLLNLPVPAKLFVDDAEYDVTETTVELSFNHPGTYTVRVESAPYLPGNFTVTV